MRQNATAIPSAVVFDFGASLFDDEIDAAAGPQRMVELADQSNIDAGTYAAVAAEAMEEVDREKRGRLVEYPTTCLTRLIAHRMGITYSVDPSYLELEFWKASDHCEPVPGAIAALQRLRRDDIRMAILSNMMFSSAVIHHELEKCGIDGYFDAVATSTDYGLRKPDPLVFAAVAGHLGVDPAECWYIGDRADIDVVGSKAAGMTGVWLNRRGAAGDDAVQPDHEVHSWQDFLLLWDDRRP